MSSTTRAWIVAASRGVVEAMKDQGLGKWNYALRSLQQYGKTNMRSYSQAKRVSAICKKMKNEKLKETEESLRTDMYLSCWGPN